jgi:hypothetical protein
MHIIVNTRHVCKFPICIIITRYVAILYKRESLRYAETCCTHAETCFGVRSYTIFALSIYQTQSLGFREPKRCVYNYNLSIEEINLKLTEGAWCTNVYVISIRMYKHIWRPVYTSALFVEILGAIFFFWWMWASEWVLNGPMRVHILRTMIIHLFIHIHQKKIISLEIAAKTANVNRP